MVANYLNQQEREDLAKDLSKLKFGQARGKIRGMDQHVRMAYIRNVQTVGKWATRYELPSLGAWVTLIESYATEDKKGKTKSDYELVQVIVEPTTQNRT
ncbi:MAG: hypothetical protein H7Y09_15000 [Chitinophagaceae bacterium]|nr:hypothetical protein [Anaerolineae bacterium]